MSNAPLDFVRANFITVTVAAAMCNVCAGAVAEWSAQGAFPKTWWFGRRRFFKTQEVVDWLQSPERAVKPSGEFGEENPSAKYPAAIVAEVLRLHTNGYGYGRIASLLKLNKSTVAKYCRGEIRAATPKALSGERPASARSKFRPKDKS